MYTSLANMSCLCCSAAFLAWVGLAVISFTMQLSVEFVNNLVAVLNVLASQVATALDTLNFALATERNQQSDTRVSPRAPRNSRHGLRPRIITERISFDRSRASEPGLWILIPPGTYLHYPHLVRHIGMPLTALLVAVRRQCWIGYHRKDLLLPLNLAAVVNQDRRRLPHLIRIRMVQFVHIQVLHRSVHLPPRELLQEFTIALRNAHLEPFTAWTQGELDEMVRRKKDKDSRPTYKTIARFLQKPKQAWKVYQQLEARA